MDCNSINRLIEKPAEKQGSPELRARLPKNAISLLSLKYRYSPAWIGKVISGKGKPIVEIIEDAEKLADIEDQAKNKIYDVVK